ncbi:2-methylcitrate dehydratase [Zobellella endophytica]|uniref:2-methylcitrate dehydratase n=1 Tax=Zobellella endophytica TaxID=2116700 RepID=A0A2P7R0I6_9GAMM|nr:MmgE/PrpD family protein [Zobellella endophytica]PSJ43734.1 2-methylcitrate dehydratase [Zobellella endophytica]
MKPIVDFIHELKFDMLPAEVVEQASLCLLDLTGVALAGRGTRLGRIMGDFVCCQYPGEVPLLFDGRRASACGAALYGATLIDSIDAHDGQVLTKGHVGVAILPGLLALARERELSGAELLTCLVVGYEIATRAGIALHASAADYHTSGAWNCLGVAAVAARLLRLDAAQTAEALGTAEFHGPRSQMMRCIDHPTMLKDGSGWGALAGVSAALLARAGFTGAPALTLSDATLAPIWADLGRRWYLLEQYFKPYPVCRWAQPAVEAVRQLRRAPGFTLGAIREIHIHSFHEATRLHTRHPTTTEQAQYSLPFAVSSALLDDGLSVQAIAETGAGLRNPLRRWLSERVFCHEEAGYNRLFPAERWAHARILFEDGSALTSAAAVARGNPENPLEREELLGKFDLLAAPWLSDTHRLGLRRQILQLAELDNAGLAGLLDDLSRSACGHEGE